MDEPSSPMTRALARLRSDVRPLDIGAILCHAIQVGEGYMACCVADNIWRGAILPDTPLPPSPIPDALCVEAHLLIVSISPNADSESIAMGA